MKLYLLRHAPAVPHGTPGYVQDLERPLTPTGIRKMQRIAKGMRALELSVDLILSSPYERARHTAEIAAEVLGAKTKLKFSVHLRSEGSPAALVGELNDSYRQCQSIMLVGHEPYLSGLIARLVTGSDSLPLNFKKGGLCKLTIHSLRYSQCATLEWLLTPKHLRAL